MHSKMGEGTASEFIPAKEFVLSTYNPYVAVICSPTAESVVAKNNLKFAQLLLPFTRLTTEVSWMESTNGQPISPRGLRITPVDIASWKPSDIDSQKNRKILNNAVAQNPPPLLEEDMTKFRLYNLGGAKGNAAEYSVQVPVSTPWFDSWRETFLKLQSESQIAQYEFLHHFMASILVISSTEGKTAEELSNTIAKLSKLQLTHQSEWPNSWAFPSVLKFYLIVHESSEDQASADAMYQSLRTMYGGNFCYMLQLQGASDDSGSILNNDDIWTPLIQPNYYAKENNVTDDTTSPVDDIIITSDLLHPLSPDSEQPVTFIGQNGELSQTNEDPAQPRGKYLAADDLKNIQTTVNEFISKALLPYIERQSRLLHESILNRRGMSKSVFSAAKRLFGATAKTASSIVYATESLEMMSRKLADVYFLFGHYSGAYQLYHQLKKDFLSDSAWTYFSSSLEMAAVSHFMMSQVDPPLAMARAFPVHYIGDAINHYIDYCRMVDSATKCALICSECLKQMDNYGEAAAIYIRMTSEECDLRSALMLEQAAYAFLRLNSPRKYALHCVLAGHRYSKAGLKMHSLNCYLQASQIYSGKGWRFAEDHVHFTIARHQSSLQITNDISKYLQSLLITPTPQPSQQIQTFYKEYLSTMAKINSKAPQEFFIPNVLSSEIRIRIAVSNLVLGEVTKSAVQEVEHSVHWDSLEEHVVRECVKNSVISFKPSRMIYHSGVDNTVNPTVPSNETFYVEVPLLNPLSIAISLRNIRLKFDSVESVDSSVVSELELQPGETKMIRFSVCASSVGRVSFNWIFYDLELSPLRVSFKQKVTIIGPRLNSNSAERCGRDYAKDLRNQINIIAKMPLLQATVEGLPSTLYHAQSIEFQIVLTDKSMDCDQRSRINSVVIAMDNMKDCLEVHSNSTLNPSLSKESVQKNYSKLKATFDGSSTVCKVPCIFKAPQSGEFATLNVLLLYQFNSTQPQQRTHRVINISIRLPLSNCLKLEYSTLKLLNARMSIGLLRAHNLTPDGNISINQMKFSHSEMKIEEFNVSTTARDGNEDNKCVQLAPMESRNVILKVQDTGNILSTKEQLALNMHWELRRPGSNSTSVKGCSRILTEDLKNMFGAEENSLVFELEHKSRTVHDFGESPCLVFPIKILVHSRSSGKIVLQMDKNITPNTIGPGVKASGDEVFFVGQTSWILDTTPMSSYTLEYSVAVTRPGIYNVAPIFIVTGQGGMTVQRKYTLHSPLIVAQSSISPTL